MKKILYMILLFSICLCSCNNQQNKFADMKEDFSKFGGSNSIALDVENQKLYFQDHEIDLEALIKDDSDICRVKEVILRNDNIYLLVSRKANRQWSFSVSRCDLMGNNLQVLYEQKELDQEVRGRCQDGLLYIEYQSQKTTFVNLYNCNTEEYSSLGSGKDVRYEDYFIPITRKYSVEKSKDQFVISDDTKELAIIDTEFLKKTEYYDLMVRYEFSPFMSTLTENKITLIYRAKSSYSLTTPYYSMLLFEYDIAANSLIYLAVLNPYDCEGMWVLYNIKN